MAAILCTGGNESGRKLRIRTKTRKSSLPTMRSTTAQLFELLSTEFEVCRFDQIIKTLHCGHEEQIRQRLEQQTVKIWTVEVETAMRQVASLLLLLLLFAVPAGTDGTCDQLP